VRGADPDLNPAAVPTADPDRRAGWRLDGPQLQTDWRLVVGWQWAFRAYGS
jgi:hypothetical protein